MPPVRCHLHLHDDTAADPTEPRACRLRDRDEPARQPARVRFSARAKINPRNRERTQGELARGKSGEADEALQFGTPEAMKKSISGQRIWIRIAGH